MIHAANFFAACTTILAWLALTAPEGHELPGIGFRYGPEPVENTARRLPDADGFRALPLSFHRNLNSAEAQRNHG